MLRIPINGFVPKELPPLDYHAMIQEMHAIGVNLNQIAARANATGHIDRAVFQYETNRLRRTVPEIQSTFTSPERRCDDGTTSIWDVKDRLDRVIDYAANPEKTENDDFQGLRNVLEYAGQDAFSH